MDFNLTPEQQNALLDAASKKLGISKEKIKAALNKAGLKETARSEELSMFSLAEIANTLAEEK